MSFVLKKFVDFVFNGIVSFYGIPFFILTKLFVVMNKRMNQIPFIKSKELFHSGVSHNSERKQSVDYDLRHNFGTLFSPFVDVL